MRKLIFKLKIAQERVLSFDNNKITQWRINPYNPLSYLTYIIALIIAFFLIGVKGVKDEFKTNPFKWQ